MLKENTAKTCLDNWRGNACKHVRAPPRALLCRGFMMQCIFAGLGKDNSSMGSGLGRKVGKSSYSEGPV